MLGITGPEDRASKSTVQLQFDADNGKILWSFNTGSGLHSGIVSYAINGKQYILVPSGWGSSASLIMPSVFPELAGLPSAATLIAFSLD